MASEQGPERWRRARLGRGWADDVPGEAAVCAKPRGSVGSSVRLGTGP